MQHQPSSSADRSFKRLGRGAIRFGHALRAADDAVFAWLCRASDGGLAQGRTRFGLALAVLCIAMLGVAWLSSNMGSHRGRIVGLSTADRAPRLDHRCARDVSPQAHIVVVAFADGDDPRSFEVPDARHWAIGDEVIAKFDGCVIERPRLLDR